MKRFLWLGSVFGLLPLCISCGDTFRPIIIPNPPAFPDPRAAHTVISINNNGASNLGSIMVVDVSGDSDIANRDVGFVPVHAVQQSANQVLVVNQSTGAVPPELGDSLTKVTFSGILVQNTTKISLPQLSAPNFVAAAPSDTTAYVTLPNYAPDPNHPGNIVPSVGVVNTTINRMVATIPVGSCPAAIAVTPDKNKLYVASNGSFCTPAVSGGSISAFNTLDRSARVINGTLSSPPLWLVARSDSQAVYVLETNGTLAALDTTLTAGPDTLTETTISVPGALSMLYDGHLNRLYIAGGSQLAVVDVSTSPPTLLGSPIAIPTVPPSSRGAQDPCLSTAANPVSSVSVAALPDGSRAYVGAFYTDSAGNICPQVTVINTSGNTVKTAAPVPGFPDYDAGCSTTRFRFTMAAGGDSSRVYLASCDGGNVNVINTFDDTYLLNLPAPVSARPPVPPNTQPPPQNPVFLMAGP